MADLLPEKEEKLLRLCDKKFKTKELSFGLGINGQGRLVMVLFPLQKDKSAKKANGTARKLGLKSVTSGIVAREGKLATFRTTSKFPTGVKEGVKSFVDEYGLKNFKVKLAFEVDADLFAKQQDTTTRAPVASDEEMDTDDEEMAQLVELLDEEAKAFEAMAEKNKMLNARLPPRDDQLDMLIFQAEQYDPSSPMLLKEMKVCVDLCAQILDAIPSTDPRRAEIVALQKKVQKSETGVGSQLNKQQQVIWECTQQNVYLIGTGLSKLKDFLKKLPDEDLAWFGTNDILDNALGFMPELRTALIKMGTAAESTALSLAVKDLRTIEARIQKDQGAAYFKAFIQENPSPSPIPLDAMATDLSRLLATL